MHSSRSRIIQAFRDEEFPQAYGALRREMPDGDDGYCIDGVLCHLYHASTGKGAWHARHTSAGIVEHGFEAGGCLSWVAAPDAVLEWSGIAEPIRLASPVLGHWTTTTLFLNDIARLPFYEFAEVLEYTYLLKDRRPHS